MRRGRLAALALGAGLLVLLIGTSVESAVIATFRPTGFELRWVSHAVAAAAVAGLTYLTLRLGAAVTKMFESFPPSTSAASNGR